MTSTTKPLKLAQSNVMNGTAPFNLADDPPTFLDTLLQEQHQLTAVEQFSRDQDALDETSAIAESRLLRYSRLLPASPPGVGQQYAFEVDLDRCSGCKACVTACHSLNGLDAKETWRDVGLLVGGTSSAPMMQHVTTACHYCLQPACISACPVDAYEKDPITGIVRHLDDQCFGCQYCTLACPYDVPKYHKTKGIVRKCDMCSQRLSQGEPPACVQACPHEAITIQIIDTHRVQEDSEASHFLPAAPDPDFTLPTTSYKTQRVFPRNMLPADYFSVSPQHPHWPLILMLVFTQLSVGAFVVGCLLDHGIPPHLAAAFRPWHATNSLVFGLVALVASVFHLGRPLYAFRGIIGLRHSWLSREILAFGIFAKLAVLYALGCWFASEAADWKSQIAQQLLLLGWPVCIAGLVGVLCSAMIYAFTRKELWSSGQTATRFLLTSAVLGVATVWVSMMVFAWWFQNETSLRLVEQLFQPMTQGLIILTVCKIAFDGLLLRYLAVRRTSPLKRSALLIAGVLSRVSLARLLAGLCGGIILPLVILQDTAATTSHLVNLTSVCIVAAAWSGCLIGELFERYLFFSAVAAPRMPGMMRS